MSFAIFASLNAVGLTSCAMKGDVFWACANAACLVM